MFFSKKGSTTPPTHATSPSENAPVNAKEKWNEPRSNITKVFATYASFFVLGMNDSSYGVLLSPLEKHYHVSHLAVSLLFLSPVVGFVVSTPLNHSLHATFGRRGIAIIAGTSQIIAYTIACLHPPFYALILGYALIGLGAGAKNASWNAFISGLDNSNEVLGLLHGCYGLGATTLPLIASVLFKRGWHWYMIYYIFLGLVALDLTLSTYAFVKHNAQKYLVMCELTSLDQGNREGPSIALEPGDAVPAEPKNSPNLSSSRLTRDCLKHRVVVLSSLFLLSYVGSEVALGGWIVTFMMDVRHGSEFQAGIVSSGFWAGITTGRVCLGFVTGQVFKSERTAAACYIICAIILQLLFWLIPSFVSSAICVAFLGFFLGPLFPCAIVCMSNLLPKYMRTVAIGVCAAIGASGACIVPFIVGAVANAKGVQALQPIILACLVVCLGIWITMGRLPVPVSSPSLNNEE